MKKRIKLTIGLFIAFVVFVILHNIVYAIFDIEEAIFFTLSLLSLLGFVILLICNIILFVVEVVRKGKKK